MFVPGPAAEGVPGPHPSAVGLASLGDALADLIPSTVLFSLIPFAFVLVVAQPRRGDRGLRCGVAPVRAAGVALRGALAREPAELAVFWLLAPPLLLLALSHLRHQTVYLDR